MGACTHLEMTTRGPKGLVSAQEAPGHRWSQHFAYSVEPGHETIFVLFVEVGGITTTPDSSQLTFNIPFLAFSIDQRAADRAYIQLGERVQ